MKTILAKYRKINISIKIVTGSILGIILGLTLREKAGTLKFLGDIFLRLVQMGVPLLIFTSIVESTASLPMSELKKVGGRTLYWFVLTTALAAIITVIIVYLFPPVVQPIVTGDTVETITNNTGGIGEIFVNFIPTNAIQGLAEGKIVQIVLFGALFGIALNMIKESVKTAQTVFDFIAGTRQVVMRIITLIMGYAPFGIMGMLASFIGTQGSEVLTSMGSVLLLVTAIDLLFFIGYTLFMSIRFRLNLIQLIKNCTNILIVALTTLSSAVTLPVSLEYVPKNLGVKERISNFVLPLGGAINFNGTPITNITCAVAAAAMNGIEITPLFLIILGVYGFISAFGNIGVAGGGIISLMVVFDMAGIPSETIVLFAGLDYFFSLTRILDNVMGNVYSALYVGIKMDEFDRDIFNQEISQKSA